jgi:hypothetical protein
MECDHRCVPSMFQTHILLNKQGGDLSTLLCKVLCSLCLAVEELKIKKEGIDCNTHMIIAIGCWFVVMSYLFFP